MQLKGIFPILKENSCGEFLEKSVKEELEKMKHCSAGAATVLELLSKSSGKPAETISALLHW